MKRGCLGKYFDSLNHPTSNNETAWCLVWRGEKKAELLELKYRIKKVVCENWEFHEQPTQVKMVFLL
jgi:hypothetical protein